MLAHAGSSAHGGFARGLGCERCNGTGYAGRTAVYEMLEMTSSLVEAANRGTPVEFVRLARQQIGASTLLHHAIGLAAKGRTTIEEAMRLSMQVEAA